MSYYYTMLDKNKSFVDKMVELIELYQKKTKLPLHNLFMYIGHENIENPTEEEIWLFKALVGAGLKVKTDRTMDKNHFIIKAEHFPEMEMEFMVKKVFHYKEEDNFEF